MTLTWVLFHLTPPAALHGKHQVVDPATIGNGAQPSWYMLTRCGMMVALGPTETRSQDKG